MNASWAWYELLDVLQRFDGFLTCLCASANPSHYEGNVQRAAYLHGEALRPYP